MKSIYIIAIAILASLASCRRSEQPEPDPDLFFTTYSYDVMASEANPDSTASTDTIFCRYMGEGVLPKDVGNSDIRALRDTLLSLGGVTFEPSSTATPVMDEDYRIATHKTEEDESCSESLRQITVCLASRQVVVWEAYNYFYPCGAAHGMYATTYVNFDIERSKILSQADIFTPGYKEELTEMLREKVSERDLMLLDGLDSVGIPADFAITTTGVRFVYSLYEIAPYSEGEIAIDLTSDELLPLLTPTGRRLLGC